MGTAPGSNAQPYTHLSSAQPETVHPGSNVQPTAHLSSAQPETVRTFQT